MRFPNAYRGVRRLFTTSLLIWFFIALTVLFPLGILTFGGSALAKALLTLTILILAAAAAATRVLAIGCVSLDEDAFRPAQRATLLAFGFFLNDLILLPLFTEWLAHLSESDFIIASKEYFAAGIFCLPIVMQAAALYYFLSATLISIFGSDNLASRLRNTAVIDLGNRLRWLLTGLFFASLLVSILHSALPEEIASSILFHVSAATVLLTYVIVAGVFVLQYLRQVEEMLFNAKNKEEFIWTGIANELFPDTIIQDTAVEPDYRPSEEEDIRYWPVEALNAPSKWARDAERFLKGELTKDEEKATRRTPKLYLCAKRLCLAESICLLTLWIAFLFFEPPSAEPAPGQSTLLPVLPWVCSLFGMIAWYLQWSALRSASIEDSSWCRPGKIMLDRAFCIVCLVFIAPIFLYLFKFNLDLGFDTFSFKSPETLFDVSYHILRFLWVAVPIHATPRILSCMRFLTDKAGDVNAAQRWRWLKLLTRLAFFLLCLSVFIGSDILLPAACTFFTGVWIFLLLNMFRALKAVCLAEEAKQDEE